MNRQPNPKRRTVLETIGAGVVGGVIFAGSASAKGNNYGNGNGLGAFLNEEAMWKESPVWDTGIVDKTGQDEADVLFGGLTDIDIPFPDAPDRGPWGVDPRALKVTSGTDVTWTWYDGPGAIDAHHLVSFFDPPYNEEFPNPFEGDPHEHPGGDGEFFVHEHLGDSFTHTFDDAGSYLYFCFPHGTPYSTYHPLLDREVENLFGQRGVVKVVEE